MASVAYELAEGEVLEIEVDDRVAEVLAEREVPLRAIPFSVLSGDPEAGEDGPPPDFGEGLTEASGRRHNGRALAKPGMWEGPKLAVHVVLGITPIWTGPPEPLSLCGGRRLPPGWYCACCDRSGEEHKLPSVPASQRPKPLLDLLAGNLRGGKAGSRRRGAGARPASTPSTWTRCGGRTAYRPGTDGGRLGGEAVM